MFLIFHSYKQLASLVHIANMDNNPHKKSDLWAVQRFSPAGEHALHTIFWLNSMLVVRTFYCGPI